MADTSAAASAARPGRVILWGIPRSMSTGFAKCIGCIPGCEVWMEPLTWCTVASRVLQFENQKRLPYEYEGNEDVYERAAAAMRLKYGEWDPPEQLSISRVKSSIEASTAKYTLVKDHSYAMYIASDERKQFIPEGFRHAFIIREPSLVYASYRKARMARYIQIKRLSDDIETTSKFDQRVCDPSSPPVETFYENHLKLWKYVRTHVDPNAIVIDASDLTSKPAEMLPKFCEAMGLPYADSHLEWDAGIESTNAWKWPCKDFRSNLQHYLGASLSSSKFVQPKDPLPRDQLTDDVIALSDEARPFYQEMFESRLVV